MSNISLTGARGRHRIAQAALLLLLSLPQGASAGPRAIATEETNKRLVLDMWHGVIEQRDDRAVMRYIAPDYIQHNVNVGGGRAGLLEGLKTLRNPPPGLTLPAHKQLIKAVAQGDIVVLVWDQAQPDPAATGQTYMGKAFDMFRIKNGMVVEHWDDTRKSVRPWH